jgi:hypothetical protein
MENNTLSYRKIGGWLLVIFIAGILNASGDIALLLVKLAELYGINLFFIHTISRIIFFFPVFSNETLFFIAMPLTLFCTIIFLVGIGTRKLFLFKTFFFAACIIALSHVLFNAITIYPRTIFDNLVSVAINLFIDSTIKQTFTLVKTLYPVFLIIGVVMMIGILSACFLYLKRSKRVAVYFGS